MKNKNTKPPIQRMPLSKLLQIADKRMLSVAGLTTYDPYRIFLNTGHLLKSDLSRLLNTTRLLFWCEQENIRRMTSNDISIPTSIQFDFLNTEQVNFIVERIKNHQKEDYSLDHPFNFDYEIFGFYLDPKIQFNRILSCWSDILINEWRVNHGCRLFVGFGYEEFSKKSHSGIKPSSFSSFTDDELSMVGDTGVNLVLLRGLWLANNMIIRLQALWDKMISEFLLKNYFLLNPGTKLNSNIKKIKKIANEWSMPIKQKQYLNQFLSMANLIDELRIWRNHDIHMVSEYIEDVYSRKTSDKDLYQLWKKIEELHNSTREAIFTLVGFIISEVDIHPKHVLRIIGEGKQANPKLFDQNNNDEKSKLQELQEITIHKDWGNNPQKTMDILMDLWGIEITSKLCIFISYEAFNPDSRD